MTVKQIGCCGAYCGTCKELTKEFCAGCKLGYEEGKRDINRARCKMKVCCFKEKKLETCADCSEYESCQIIRAWFDKKGYIYKKYRESIEFIRKYGYDVFLEQADQWKGPYGKLS